MNNKHYQNDFKKLIGYDESRTASERKLDKLVSSKIGIRKHAEGNQKKPEKKVKLDQTQKRSVEHSEVLKKIMKALQSDVQIINKTIKALSILKKCLNDVDFNNKITQEQASELLSTLLKTNQRIKGEAFGQLLKANDLLIECLTLIAKNLFQKTQSDQNKKIQIKLLFLKLISDDSFMFQKDLVKFKSEIFTIFDNIKQQSQTQSKMSQFHELTMHELLHLPNLNFDWVRTSIATIIKDFLIEYKELMNDSKAFLKAYNNFLQQKKSTSNAPTSNIMGQASSTKVESKIVIVENQDGASQWCKKQ